MKLEKTFAFFLLIAALVFCVVSCGGKGSKYDDLDDYDAVDNDSEKEDEDKPLPVTDEDTDTDDSNVEIDDDKIHDDADSEPDNENPDNTDTVDDSDHSRPDGDNPNNPDDEDPDIPDNDMTDDKDDNGNDDTPEENDEDPFPGKEDPAVICTGLTACYNLFEEMECPDYKNEDFFGQDAQYAEKQYCLKRSFSTTTSSETVTDNITALIWQKNTPEQIEGCSGNSGKTCSHQEAVNYCNNLNLEGKTWRLPTLKELETLIDFSQTPTINQKYFNLPSTSLKKFWTETDSQVNNGKFWVIDFGTALISDEASNKFFYPKCVSGNELSDSEFEETVDQTTSQKIIKDEVNNLIWTTCDNSLHTWQSALNYCKTLNYAGRKNWRLPNINELATIINYSRSAPASDFPSIGSAYFWSSSTNSTNIKQAWRTYTYSGEISYGDKTKENHKVICVK